MRDLTRGGLASALVEISQTANLHINIEEAKLPVEEEVKGASEMLGFDPIYIANEGCFICFVPQKYEELALEALRSEGQGKKACCIGRVSGDPQGVTIKSQIGVNRVVEMLSGEQLP